MIAAAAMGQNPPPAVPAPLVVDPAKIPSADAIRPFLFAGASAISVDDTSIRYVARYAFPDIPAILEAVAASRNMSGMLQGRFGPGNASGGGNAAAPGDRGRTPPAPGGSPAGTSGGSKVD